MPTCQTLKPRRCRAVCRLTLRPVRSTLRCSRRSLRSTPFSASTTLKSVHGLAALDLLLIDAGRFDEYNLQIAARRFVRGLQAHGIDHVHEEFDGGHRGMAWRYGVSLSMIAEALK